MTPPDFASGLIGAMAATLVEARTERLVRDAVATERERAAHLADPLPGEEGAVRACRADIARMIRTGPAA